MIILIHTYNKIVRYAEDSEPVRCDVVTRYPAGEQDRALLDADWLSKGANFISVVVVDLDSDEVLANLKGATV